MMDASSRVTSASCRAARSRISSRSIGLTKRMSATVASSLSAAASAAGTRVPNPRMAIFLPSRRTTPRPTSTVSRPAPSAAPQPAPPGERTAAGPGD
ncbi:hypothetical protein G6F54_014350 [Rhizopus delemar]|nr:hypothetical protein G6F54_014350 [Rhizopus delemar]